MWLSLTTKCLNIILGTIFRFFCKIVEKLAHLLADKVKKLVHVLARRHAKLENWHVFGMLARQVQKLARGHAWYV